jgi:transcriptional regulator with XRE-family HTH domain
MLHIFVAIVCKFDSLSLVLQKKPTTMQFIDHNIKELRIKQNYTQEYVAQKMGMSQTTLSRIESDPNHPVTDDEVIKFAQVLKTTIEKIKEQPSTVSFSNNKIKGNGYVHSQTNNGTDNVQQAIGQLHETSQQVLLMMQEIKEDKEFLREECRQLRQRDEKWMAILSDMQKQLVDFLSKK